MQNAATSVRPVNHKIAITPYLRMELGEPSPVTAANLDLALHRHRGIVMTFASDEGVRVNCCT